MNAAKVCLCICFSAIFLAMFLFYTAVLPIIPYNGDDWRYLSQYRSLLPSLKEWNPARILPEIIHPFLGYFSAYIIYPICNNYIRAFTISTAIMMSISITLLTYTVYVLLKKITNCTAISISIALFFILASFLLFKLSNANNVFLFYSSSLMAATYYIIPSIMNSILVLLIAYTQYAEEEISYLQYTFEKTPFIYGIILLFIYLAQFSITFSSAISAIYAFNTILMRLILNNSNNIYEKVVLYIKNFSKFDALLFFIIVCWICAAIFDTQGARYASLKPTAWNFADASLALLSLLSKINISIKYIALVSISGIVFRIIYKKYTNKITVQDKKIIEIIFTIFLTTVLLTVLYISISARTVIFTSRIDTTYGVFFFLILVVAISIAYLVLEIHRLALFIPFLLLFLLVATTNSTKPWAVPHGTAYERGIVESWLADAQKADLSGNTTCAIIVPELTWPHPPEWFGEVFAHTLYTHGITSRRLNITLKKARGTAP